MFQRHAYDAGLPPVRLHDARHLAATLAHAAGGSMKDIQAMLRHASYAITAQLYTSVLDELSAELAEQMTTMVPRRHVASDSRPTLGCTTVAHPDPDPR